MPIKNYTTAVPAVRSVSEIVGAVVRSGATAVQQEFGSNGKVLSVSFRLVVAGVECYYRLPVRPDGVRRSLRRDFPRAHFDEARLERISWRIIRDWVLAQCALVEAGAAETAEVFLPYLQLDGTGKTLYEGFLESPRFAGLLGSGEP